MADAPRTVKFREIAEHLKKSCQICYPLGKICSEQSVVYVQDLLQIGALWTFESLVLAEDSLRLIPLALARKVDAPLVKRSSSSRPRMGRYLEAMFEMTNLGLMLLIQPCEMSRNRK